MDLMIKNKTAVITGGDSGIGLATAKILAQGGANIVLSDKNQEQLTRLQTKFVSIYRKVSLYYQLRRISQKMKK